MALVKCKNCGQMVSDKAEKCPKCGYSVRLSMEQEQSVEIHSTTETEGKKSKTQQKGSKKGIIIAFIVVVIIGCGVLFALVNKGDISIRDIPTIEAKLQNVTTTQDAKQLIEGTVWEHTVNTDESELGFWVKVEFANGRYKSYYMQPSDEDWTDGGEGDYKIDEGKFANTGEKYIAICWEGGGYHGWPIKYTLILNNFQLAAQSKIPDPETFQFPTDNGFMKLVDVFDVTQENAKVEDSPSTSLTVEPERTPDESFYTITNNGVANISLGSSMKDYNMSYKSEDEKKGLCYNNSFVEVQERTSEGYDYNVLYMNLYKDSEKIFSLYGGTSEEKPDVLNTTVHSIFVYSPKFKLPNGIHVGMSVKELINNYGATLQLNESEGGESIAFITLNIPDFSNFIFVVDKEDLLKAKGEYFFEGYNPQTGNYNENYCDDIERETKELGKLGIIVIGTEFDTF